MKFYKSELHTCERCWTSLEWSVENGVYYVQCSNRHCVWWNDPIKGETLGRAVERFRELGAEG